MAKKNETKNEETAIAIKNTTTNLEQAPDFMSDGREGLEGFSKDDVLLPRLALAQAQSPEVIEGDPRFVEGLKPGDLFNSLTKENYGREVYVQILRKDPLRAMEFYPQEEGGGVKDPNVPLDDERLKWGENGEKPRATLFRDYSARLLPSGEMISLSFKSGGLKVAKALNGLIVTRGKAIYAGRYVITTDTELKPRPHKVYKVANAGWVTKEQYEEGRQLWLSVKDLDVRVDREQRREDPEDDGYAGNPGEEGDTDFPVE